MSSIIYQFIILGYTEQHILLIMELIDKKDSPDDRKRKFTDSQIVKIHIVLFIASLDIFEN